MTTGLPIIEPRETTGIVIGKIIVVHELLVSESDISPRNQKISIALRELVELLLKSYGPAETAAILNHTEVAALRISLLDRLSEAEPKRHENQKFTVDYLDLNAPGPSARGGTKDRVGNAQSA